MSTPDSQLKNAITRAGDGLSRPVPTDLAVRLEAKRARVDRRRIGARVLAVAAAVVVIGATAAVVSRDDDERSQVDIGGPSTPAPSTTEAGGLTPTSVGGSDSSVPTSEATTTTAPITTAPTEPAGEPITAASQISLYGLGAVRGGMTVTEAEAATGQTFRIEGFEDFGGACYFARVDGFEDLYFLITTDVPPADPREGIIGRASVTAPEWQTISGIHVGSTEAEVRAAYGANIVESPHEYVPGGKYLDFIPSDAADAAFKLRFETDATGVVTEMHAGLEGPASYIEGCA